MRTSAEKKFIKIVREKCKENNVKLLLKNTVKLKLGKNSYCGGYFEDLGEKAVLSCAMKNPLALSILVHEFSHMEQWIDNVFQETGEYCSNLERWLNGEEINNIYNQIDRVKLMELDCERRAVKNIKKYNLPLNIQRYTQLANVYIFFYNYLKESRKWSKPGNAPYSKSNKKLWSMCPKKFMPDEYYKYIPYGIYEKFKELDI